MKHTMQEMSQAELESTFGGGVFEDFFTALGRFIDGAIEEASELYTWARAHFRELAQKYT